jgi:DNA-binding NarL/FixJ family response regulator
MPIRIMIADDHAVFRNGLRALLEGEPDLEVVAESGSGAETLRVLSENEVEVLVLDLSMPGASGSALARAALQRRPRTAIVILTMHEDAYYVEELLKVGVQGYVLKRSTGKELLDAIRSAHAGRRYIDPVIAADVIAPHIGLPSARNAGPLGLLTPREREVCTLLAYGHTNAEVGQKLSISERTVESHRTRIMTKLNRKTRVDLVRFAIDSGLIRLP